MDTTWSDLSEPQDFLRVDDFLAFLRPDPDFLPPPSCLLTEAHAMRAAVFADRAGLLLALLDVAGLALLLVGVGRLVSLRHVRLL